MNFLNKQENEVDFKDSITLEDESDYYIIFLF